MPLVVLLPLLLGIHAGFPKHSAIYSFCILYLFCYYVILACVHELFPNFIETVSRMRTFLLHPPPPPPRVTPYNIYHCTLSNKSMSMSMSMSMSISKIYVYDLIVKTLGTWAVSGSYSLCDAVLVFITHALQIKTGVTLIRFHIFSLNILKQKQTNIAERVSLCSCKRYGCIRRHVILSGHVTSCNSFFIDASRLARTRHEILRIPQAAFFEWNHFHKH